MKKIARTLIREELEPMRRDLDQVLQRLKHLEEQVAGVSKTLAVSQSPVAPVTKIDREQWKAVAQEGELAFHKRRNFRSGDGFITENDAFWTRLGYSPGDFRGKRILDLGAGSRLRSKFFQGANVYVIEPLADRYISEVEWCDLRDAHKVFSVPAEEPVAELQSAMDFVFSINVLDHCYDFRSCIANAMSYLKPDGVALLVFDLHETTDDLHPIVLNRDICREIFHEAKASIVEEASHPPFHGGGISREAVAYTLRHA